MKVYYNCMNQSAKYDIVTLMNLCAGKSRNDDLDGLRAESVKLFEVTEIPVAKDITDVFLANNSWCSLHSDGTIWDLYCNKLSNIPPVKYVIPRSITSKSVWFCGKDGIIYNDEGNAQPDDKWRLKNNNSFCGYVQKDGNMLRLVNPQKKPYYIPLARLKDMDSYFIPSGAGHRWSMMHYDWNKDIIEAKSNRIILGSDGTCLFEWNGLVYSVVPQRDKNCSLYSSDYSITLDAAYREDLDPDDIAILVSEDIYVNKKGKLVFLKGWDDYSIDRRHRKYDDHVINAKKWENLTQCEIIGNRPYEKHLVGKTKDGRILSTFEPDICGDLKKIDHAFVFNNEFAFFVVK